MATRFAAPMARLIDELRKLPGVGTKTAQRYAFHILRAADSEATALADAMAILRDAVAEMDARYQLLARGGFANLGERIAAGHTELPYGEHRGGVGEVVSGRSISAWSESNVTLNVTLADQTRIFHLVRIPLGALKWL